jgi:hypothetical protein
MAPTVWLVFITTVQLGALVGIQFADQPPNEEPGLGTTVRVTLEPRGKYPVHPAPERQLIPTGLLTTVPFPEPTW